jgi:hypothetical protein
MLTGSSDDAAARAAGPADGHAAAPVNGSGPRLGSGSGLGRGSGRFCGGRAQNAAGA